VPAAAGYAALALGGLLLHLRVHPPGASVFNWIPLLFAAANTLPVPLLLLSRSLVGWGVAFAWVSAAAGTIGMAWFSAATWELPPSVQNILLRSTLPDILIVWVKVPLAWAAAQALGDPERPRRRGCVDV